MSGNVFVVHTACVLLVIRPLWCPDQYSVQDPRVETKTCLDFRPTSIRLSSKWLELFRMMKNDSVKKSSFFEGVLEISNVTALWGETMFEGTKIR